MDNINLHNSDLVFKRVVKEDFPKLTARQINKIMYARGYKLYTIGRLSKHIKKLYDLEDLHGKVKVFLRMD